MGDTTIVLSTIESKLTKHKDFKRACDKLIKIYIRRYDTYNIDKQCMLRSYSESMIRDLELILSEVKNL